MVKPAARSKDLAKDLARAVKEANRQVYNNQSLDQYDRNPSIFETGRQREILEQLKTFGAERPVRDVLDIGTGTGNILRLARDLWPRTVGLDLGENLLAQLRARQSDLLLVAADGERLPFGAEAFDLVTLYGVLHHLLDPAPTFAEILRVLRPGGILYTDHDPNRFFGRFYRPFYLLAHRGRPGFASATEDLAEFHHTRSPGLDPVRLTAALRRLGFARAEYRLRITTNPELPRAATGLLFLLRGAARLWPLKSFHTHFALVARK